MTLSQAWECFHAGKKVDVTVGTGKVKGGVIRSIVYRKGKEGELTFSAEVEDKSGRSIVRSRIADMERSGGEDEKASE